jgi:hypothetical protein
MPAIVKHVQVDIIDLCATVRVDVVLQQLNCLATSPHGLSETIAKAWPWANVYKRRTSAGARNFAVMEHRAKPGSCVVSGRPKTATATSLANAPRFVAGLMGQLIMGRPGQYDRYFEMLKVDVPRGYVLPPEDTAEQREGWFVEALGAFVEWAEQQGDVRVIVLPEDIGCGKAGGNKRRYKAMLEKHLVACLPDHIHVLLCSLPVKEADEEITLTADAGPSSAAPSSSSSSSSIEKRP